VNASCSILHISEHEIVLKLASNLGISLGINDKESTKPINDLLDLEVDRAMEQIINIAAVKPINEADINNLGVNALQSICEDSVPTEGLGSEDVDVVLEGYMAPLQPAIIETTAIDHQDAVVSSDKPNRT